MLESFLEFIQLAFLLVQVLDETASSFLHLVEATLQTHPVRRLVPLTMFDFVVGDRVLRMPDIVSYELLNGALP